MQLGKSSINYIWRVQVISQRMQGVTIDRIISLFAIMSLDHDQYPGVKNRYLTRYTALVNCDSLQLSGLLYIKGTRQRALGIPNAPPSNTIANPVLNTPSNPPQNKRPATQPTQSPTQPYTVVYPPARGYIGNASPQWCGKQNPVRGATSTTPTTPQGSNFTKTWDAQHWPNMATSSGIMSRHQQN